MGKPSSGRYKFLGCRGLGRIIAGDEPHQHNTMAQSLIGAINDAPPKDRNWTFLLRCVRSPAAAQMQLTVHGRRATLSNLKRIERISSRSQAAVT
jgi:hypothetical protein